MSFLRDVIAHPRRLWLRRALFQIHLWLGVLFALYLIGISLSGAVLVFRQELTRWSVPGNLSAYEPAHVASPEQVISRFAQAEPGGTVVLLQMPSAQLPAFLLNGKNSAGGPTRWWADPATAALQPAPRNWIDTLLDLHDYLLLPHAWGMQVNACGAAGLLTLALTGILIWWPGVRLWTRGLRLNLRANWRRVNYDLHNAIGFWTLAIVSWWAISGVYFGFYRQVTALVAFISPLRGMAAPSVAPRPAIGTARTTLAAVLRSAQNASPKGRLWSISDPSLKGTECYALLDLRAAGDFSHRDIVRISTADARVLSVWHYGERRTLGDWLLWSMHPLHFGTTWGLLAKTIWSLLGISLAALTATGLLMYWNRFLRHRYRALRAPLMLDNTSEPKLSPEQRVSWREERRTMAEPELYRRAAQDGDGVG